jgi:hypothetical protein
MRLLRPFLSLSALAPALCAQGFEFLPGTRYDDALPRAAAVLGHEAGEEISTHAEVERYAQALDAASDRVALVRYGESWGKRALYYLVVTSPANHARLAEVRAGMARLADPRGLAEPEAARLLDALPAVTWLGYTVHGDEASGSDAGLLLAYHLAAAQGDELVDTILRESIVLIDPLQNPDGRDRFVRGFRDTRGRWPDAEPDAAEHNQAWPGGRTNHYFFDMNRDWFAMTQPETRARIEVFLDWWPVVFADVHEMGSNASYFFAPPAEPINPEVTRGQREWLARYGRNNARWFDRFGFDYFTREQYDCFYPGYGEGWPLLHGSIGMTYEQGSTRGLRVRREDEVVVAYRDCVQHHFIASLATAETTARGRREALEAFLTYRRDALQEGERGPVREFVLPPGRDPLRARKLAALLAAQGVEVKRGTGELRNARTTDYYGGSEQARSFPAGTFVVSMAQPAKRLAFALLTRHQEMGQEFLAEQLKKRSLREDNDFYDLTAWSLPLLYDLECYAAADATGGDLTLAPAAELAALPPAAALDAAAVAYLIPWGANAHAAAALALQRDGVRLHTAGKRFSHGGRTFPAGTLVVKVAGNPADLHARIVAARAATGAEVVAVDSSWVDEGVGFGSSEVRFLPAPRIAVAFDRPVDANSVGWLRYLLEQTYSYPVTAGRTRQLGRARLERFNVLVFPDGSDYDGELPREGAARIKAWVENGGTLITLGEATRWLTGKDVGLLASAREMRKKPGEKTGDKAKAEPEAAAEKKPDGDKPAVDGVAAAGGEAAGEKAEPGEEPFDYAKAIEPEKELPGRTPGAILRVRLDGEHWLAFGYGEATNVLMSSRNIYTPVKLDKGRNVAVYETEDKLVVSGFTWEEKRRQLAQKAYLVHQPLGRGHVVAFAEDPNVRGFTDGQNLLLLNAILFGPGY